MDLRGIKVNFLGDSITEGLGTSGTEHRFDNVLAGMAGFSVVRNYGIGGTRISYNSSASEIPVWDLYFCARAVRMDLDADLVVVFGGTNDYGHGNAPMGSESDKTPDTFFGALNWLADFLNAAYPDAKKVFMTPMRREGDEIPSPLTGCRLSEYADAVIKAAKMHGMEVLDLYRTLPLDPNDAEIKEKYVPDGLHPNDAGHAIIAEHLHKFLLTV